MPAIYDDITTPFLENDRDNGIHDALKLGIRDDRLVIMNPHDAGHKDPRIPSSLGRVQTPPLP